MQNAKGFTIIESVLGIIIMSIAMISLNVAIYPIAYKSIEPIYLTKASFLAQAVINEIQTKAYDEASIEITTNKRCNEIGSPICTNISDLGSDSGETTRNDFDDIDDFNGFVLSGGNITGLNSSDSFAYNNYILSVKVSYDGDLDGNINESGTTEKLGKLISVSVTTPNKDKVVFSSYAFNH